MVRDATGVPVEHETIDVRIDGDGVAWVTLDRPEKLNAFNDTMRREIAATWASFRTDADVRCIVLTGAGDRAFCTGIDRDEALNGEAAFPAGPLHWRDPGEDLGPKANGLWKPVIAAVRGMACGGAFYLLGEVDIIIASDDATFFDPHVTYGMAAVFETIHLVSRMPFGEVLRMQLTGAHERMSASRAHQIGFVSEVVPGDDLLPAAGRLATIIASQPPAAVQATVRAAWTALDIPRRQALEQGRELVDVGNSPEALAEGQATFASGARITPRVR